MPVELPEQKGRWVEMLSDIGLGAVVMCVGVKVIIIPAANGY